jgi:hypothetical protein
MHPDQDHHAGGAYEVGRHTGQMRAAAAPAARFFGQTGASIGVALPSALLAQQLTFSRRCAGAAR